MAEETVATVEMKSINAAVPAAVHLALRMHSIRTGVSLQKLIGDIVVAYAKENKIK
jgi:hypothetical protein